MLTWSKLNSLLDYWNERPPMHIILQGIAMSLGASFPSSAKKVEEPSSSHITSAEELIGILQHSGLNFGVIHGGRR